MVWWLMAFVVGHGQLLRPCVSCVHGFVLNALHDGPGGEVAASCREGVQKRERLLTKTMDRKRQCHSSIGTACIFRRGAPTELFRANRTNRNREGPQLAHVGNGDKSVR